MGMTKIYTCNICREELENPIKAFGIHFSTNTQFILGGYGCTDGVHICYRCSKQLRQHLNSKEIEKNLGLEGEEA